MNTTGTFPAFDDCFPELNEFILKLVNEFELGKIKSWDDLENKVNAFFPPRRMEKMEALVPGWKKMASYSERITLVHVMCVFLGLFMLPEFQRLTPDQKQLAKWIVLLHDVAKFHIRGNKDTMHAFRSGVYAAYTLPKRGFPITRNYHDLLKPWGQYTAKAFLAGAENDALKPDNRKLPHILKGIDQLFGEKTPAALITKTVLLHVSLAVDPFYPTPSPLTPDETRRYIGLSLLPLLRVMMLADNEGWSIFDPETRARQRKDTLKAFEDVAGLIS